MSTSIRTESGRTRILPEHLAPEQVAGLDEDGRIVVKSPEDAPFLFGLTLCCNAYDKGYSDGVYCRRCAGSERNADQGNYLFPVNGTYPGLDPVKEIS